ncbi:MAG: hypothetical protein IJO97_02275 [Lachnospiraceae bacterium]|nr:hypothetical protein [Lachnospiraceae bacterium]
MKKKFGIFIMFLIIICGGIYVLLANQSSLALIRTEKKDIIEEQILIEEEINNKKMKIQKN